MYLCSNQSTQQFVQQLKKGHQLMRQIVSCQRAILKYYQMLTNQWRITHTHLKRNTIKIHGNLITSLKTEPNAHDNNTRGPQFQRLSSFRQSKRYNSGQYQGKIRQRINNHQSYQHLEQKKTSPLSMTTRPPKLLVTQSPTKIHTLSIKRDFVFNFYRKGKFFVSRRKKIVQNAKA